MARNVATSIENNFVNGLVTEATALNFPEAAAIDTDNCVFDSKGNVTRRLGFDFEEGYDTEVVVLTDKVVNTFLWENAAGSGDYNFVVKQLGDEISFYAVSGSGALSSNLNASTIDLTTFQVAGSPDPGLTEAQFAYGKGYLFVTHPTCEPFYVEYDPDTDTFSAQAIDIQVRDFEGVDDSLNFDDRPSTITALHQYNLYNQGWAQRAGSTSAYAYWDSTRSDYPSNADVWWQFKDANENISSSLFNSINRGNSPAPKGYYLLDAFYLDRSAASGVAGLSVVSSGINRPSTTAFFASRVFYAGVNAQGFSNKIYFSQIIESDLQFGRCHQVNDPTSEFQFDLLPSDGGVINILECGTIVRLISTQSALLVFASNGVWSISGSTGTGFAANDYTVRRISSVPSLTASSFVDAGGVPIWWNSDGIYTLSAGDALGNVSVQALSEKKIKTFYNDEIPNDSKRYAKGFYNNLDKVVQWAYRSTVATDVTERYEFDRILCLNITSGAFYPWSFGTDVCTIKGLVAIQGLGSTVVTADVTDSLGATVTTAAGADVTSVTSISQSLASVFKYLVTYTDAGTTYLTFAEENSLDYHDWGTRGEEEYESYFTTGYKVRGDALKRFQSNYLFVYANNNDPSIFDVQGIWDYATSGSTGDFTSVQRCTFTADNRKYSHKRLKIRGSGFSVQFKFISVAGEPFDITGWSVFETANASI